MKPQDLAEALLREDFLRELHHLLWIEPQLNRGQHDEGWNCRDHALIVAGVAQMLGFKAALLFGRAAFVQGAREGAPPLGIDVSPHAWVGVEGAGQYDLSVRLSAIARFPDTWKDWHVAALVADRFAPPGTVRLVYASRPDEYDNGVASASHLIATNSAIYYGEEYMELSAKVVSNGLESCNSLLTNWLRTEFGDRQDLHARAIMHFVDRLQGIGTSLLSLSRVDAWRDLARRPGNAVWRVCSRSRLA